MNNLNTLNSRYAIANQLRFTGLKDVLALAEISNAHSTATICLHGAQLMAWQPVVTNAPVIWMSKLAMPTPGKAMRGGVPVCWPWFGAHPVATCYPAHGYARTQPWSITETRTLSDGSTEIGMVLMHSDSTRKMWQHPSTLEILFTVGKTLKIALKTTNPGNTDFIISEALHTYFHVGNIEETRVLGLESYEYLDKTCGGKRGLQHGAINFANETDRVYVNTDGECLIEDNRLERRILITKSGSRSTVVWTPWNDKANKMGDFGADSWREMVCVESANALENMVTVEAGKTHTMTAEYEVNTN